MAGEREDRPGSPGPTAASALLHALALAAMLLTLQRMPGGHGPPQTQVQMMFERPGQSGLAGANAPTPNQGVAQPRSAAPSPTPPAEGERAPEPGRSTEDLVAPEEAQPPSPLAETPNTQATLQSAPRPVPEAKLAPPHPPRERTAEAERQARRAERPMRLRMRGVPRPSRSTSPFDHPMDLSFASRSDEMTTPQRHGSGRSVDLSLGPMVKAGSLVVPFASAGISGVSDDYNELLQEWIQRHLYYPQAAAERGEDGVSGVHVAIDRSGHVISIEPIVRSGHEILDDATSGMFRGAKLPPVPPDMTGSHFDIDLRIHYILTHSG